MAKKIRNRETLDIIGFVWCCNCKRTSYVVKKIIATRAAEMCAQDMRSFYIVKGKGFQSFFQYLLDMRPGYAVKDVLPSSQTISRRTTEIYTDY